MLYGSIYNVIQKLEWTVSMGFTVHSVYDNSKNSILLLRVTLLLLKGSRCPSFGISTV